MVATWESSAKRQALVATAMDWAESQHGSDVLQGLAQEESAEVDNCSVEALLDELAARAEKVEAKEVAIDLGLTEVSSADQHSLLTGVEFTGEVFDKSEQKQPFAAIPTWLLLVWLYLLMPTVFLVVQWESARTGLADLNARLPQTEWFGDVRKFIRTELAGKPGDFRLITGSNVRLRAAPGMKSEVLLLLPKDSVVVVHGKEDRTWRLVSYQHQDYMIDGYVSAAFLKKVKR